MEKLNDSSFEEIIYDDGEPCLVMFSRKSCHVCQAVHPKIEELAADDKYKGKFGFFAYYCWAMGALTLVLTLVRG